MLLQWPQDVLVSPIADVTESPGLVGECLGNVFEVVDSQILSSSDVSEQKGLSRTETLTRYDMFSAL